jgi:DNA-binding transcriptional ArsR family regulator
MDILLSLEIDNEARALLCQAFKALAEPHRMKIFLLLLQGAQCNCSLGETLNIANNLLSHHLKILRKANLINIQPATMKIAVGFIIRQSRHAKTHTPNFHDPFQPRSCNQQTPKLFARILQGKAQH